MNERSLKRAIKVAEQWKEKEMGKSAPREFWKTEEGKFQQRFFKAVNVLIATGRSVATLQQRMKA